MPARAVEVAAYLITQFTGIGCRSDDDDAGGPGIAHAVVSECLGIGELTVDLVNSRLRIRHLSSPLACSPDSGPVLPPAAPLPTTLVSGLAGRISLWPSTDRPVPLARQTNTVCPSGYLRTRAAARKLRQCSCRCS